MPNLFMIDLLGTAVTEEEKRILQHPNVGALLLFTKNIINRAQLCKLITTIRSIRPDIFIAIDHEGGYVQRIQRHGFRALPAARVFGDAYDIDKSVGIQLARQYGEIMATDLIQCGIDLSLAPILDLHRKSRIIAGLDRSFHSQPDAVTDLAGAYIDGMHAAGMPAVGKHFPGHGSVVSDSHIEKPMDDTPKEQFWNEDLKPFIRLINQKKLDGVMPAHVTYRAVDSQPAGFSKIWLQDILRNELNFSGFIISDCLGMTGADIGDMQTRIHKALIAGCDMLILCNQSRELLSDVLKSTDFKQSQRSLDSIDAFKKKMLRFSKSQQENLTLMQEFPADDEELTPHTPQLENTLNNTKTV